jgi:FkbM family methyltransferase
VLWVCALMIEGSVSDTLASLFAEGIEGARKREQSEFDRLLEANHGRLVLFGAGTLGQQALNCLRADGVEPLAFSDNNSAVWGQSVSDLTVLSPEDAAHRFGASALFVVTIWNDKQRFAETAERLAALGCRRVVSSPGLRWKYRNRIPPFPFFFLDLPSRVHQSAADVFKAATLWEDEQSRREYLSQIRMRLLGDLEHLPPPVPNQYAPSDLFSPIESEVFVDCGAFDGDTVQSFISSWGGKFQAVKALEPDPSSYKKLVDYVERQPGSIAERVEVIQVAIGEETGVVPFRADGTMGAAVSADGDVRITCVTLDELFDAECVSYIKMDIEGQEPAALRGASRLLARCRPVLAICVYHELDHLWSIPIYLHQHLNDYALYLRPHKADGWDLIVYAVPVERLVARQMGHAVGRGAD